MTAFFALRNMLSSIRCAAGTEPPANFGKNVAASEIFQPT